MTLFSARLLDGCVHAQDERLRVVWRGLVVGENNLHTQISTWRGLLGNRAIAPCDTAARWCLIP